jgi:Cu(I)/Ag(I) efflux system membrane protein CusA/SilA
MQRIAVPMIGGMISSTLLTLIVIPAIFGLVKGFRLANEGGFDGQPPLPAEKLLKRPRRVPEPAE